MAELKKDEIAVWLLKESKEYVMKNSWRCYYKKLLKKQKKGNSWLVIDKAVLNLPKLT